MFFATSDFRECNCVVNESVVLEMLFIIVSYQKSEMMELVPYLSYLNY